MGRPYAASLWTHLIAGIVLSGGAAQAAKVLQIFNPWDSQRDVTPQVSFDDGKTWQKTKFSTEYCGWFQIAAPATPAKIRVSDGKPASAIEVPLNWVGDTLFLSGMPGKPVSSPAYNGLTGTCQITNLAATIRDFDNVTATDFESPTFPKGFRSGMVAPQLGSDDKPVASEAGEKYFTQFPDWFRDVEKMNATTCVDIPLSLDDEGLYSYYASTYFPIDTFQNPFNNLVTKPNDNRYKAKEDNKLHNFGFCLESHASFTYRKGQTFTFSGDDDVWVFINKKLVIDLGGIHTELTGTVDLDSAAESLGLETGKTYPWDFFFCERNTSQSHLRIRTDLDLRTRSDFRVDRKSAAGSAAIEYTIFGVRPGQGCVTSSSSFSAAGRFLLTGAGSTQEIGGGVHFGGIKVANSLGSIVIDTSKIQGLSSGVYTLRIQAIGDSTKFQEFRFTVPVPVVPPDPPPPPVPPETDSLPKSAFIFDTDLDGRADRIVLRFQKPLKHTDSLEFRWPDPASGALETRRLPISEVRSDSGGLLLTADLSQPFAFGATSCPSAGCGGLGALITGSGNGQVVKRFAVQDRIAPIIARIELRYSLFTSTPDTLLVRFSEPIVFDAAKAAKLTPWVSWGRPSADSLGKGVPYTSSIVPTISSVSLLVRAEGAFKPVKDDSARVTMLPQGLVSDPAGNSSKRFATWTPLVFGPMPLVLNAQPYIPVRIYRPEWGEPPPGPNVTILVRTNPKSPWRALDGSKPTIDTARVTGIVLRTNRIVLGGFYLFDLQGTFVTSADVSLVNQALEAGTLQPDDRGFYEVFFTWNGRADNGTIVPSSVYLARIFGWKLEGMQRVMVNQVHRIGWFVPQPIRYK